MNFEQLLEGACSSAHLPNMTRAQLSSALSDQAKKTVMKLDPLEFGKILSMAIEAINKGSVESIDVLIRKQINLA